MADKEYPINKFVSRLSIGENSKDLPVVSKILKQLTPEKIEAEIEEIKKIKLPPELQKWVKEYEKVGERDEFLWNWTHKISEIITFSFVAKKYLKSLRNTKFLTSMLVVLLDDVTDRIKDKELLNECLKIPFNQAYINYDQLDQREKNYIGLSIKLWKEIKSTIKKYPRFKEFKDIVEYDIGQVLNAMEYAYLINKNPNLINKREYWLYLTHGMQAMVYSTFDLMCSKFNIKEVALFRRIVWEAQEMARLGNCLSTWEREIKENDFASGIIAYAVEGKTINPSDLKNNNKTEIFTKVKNSNIETNFLKRWENKYYRIKRIGKETKDLDVERFLSGLEDLLTLELASKNYK